MPQMNPMNWMMLLLFSTFIYWSAISIVYFEMSPTLTSLKAFPNKNNKIIKKTHFSIKW